MMKGSGCRLVRGRPAAASVVPAPTVVPTPTGAAAVVIVIRRFGLYLWVHFSVSFDPFSKVMMWVIP